MKFYQNLGLILISALLFSSCANYHDDVLNGAVLIEMLEAPDNKSFITSSSQPIKIKFSTHTKLDSVSVALYVEDNSKFDTSGVTTQ